MKPQILIVCLLLLAVLACGSPAAFPPPDITAVPLYTATSQLTVRPTLTLLDQVSFKTTDVNDGGNDPVYIFVANIPYLQGIDASATNDPRVKTFNDRMLAMADEQLAQFKEQMKVLPSGPSELISSLNINNKYISPKGYLISVKLEMSSYIGGSAHPNNYSITFNYDLTYGEEVRLDQLFLPGSDYLQVLSKYCSAQLSTRDIGFAGFSQGAAPTPENYQRWNVSSDGLMITFDEYQVAPYAAGAQVVVIPFTELDRVIDKQGVLKPFLP